MARQAAVHYANLYSELYPVSSATIIGAGLITITMGVPAIGVGWVMIGFGVGLFGVAIKTVKERKAGGRILLKRKK